MAGTDTSLSVPTEHAIPAVILVDPQLGENIGMVARAMLNCGLTDLRLVRPRDGWPNAKAVSASSGADSVIERVRLFSTTEDAITDLSFLYAATARDRDMTKRVVTPDACASEIRAKGSAGCGILFGGEAKGLKNDDIALADTILMVPLNPEFTSLNLSQAVLLAAYEWYKLGDDTPADVLAMQSSRPANKKELTGLFEHLESTLDDSGFFHVREKRPIMARNLRNLLHRAAPTEQEIRTLRGVIKSLFNHRG
ncbi:MAG: RNA methyltransferase [Rhodospirillales bacterium]|nr:RNA methyltransferase [Rhodospirillales bacterium]